MTLDEYNAFCGALPGANHVIQWRGAHVWKVGPKVFAIGRFDDGEPHRVSFKVTDIAYELLAEQPGLRPAPHLASRGMKWIQQYGKPGLSKRDLKRYVAESHRLVAAGLTKKLKRELGLD